MPNCYLHVGTHKTGSSAIQAFLLAKRDDLINRGILVPVAGLRPNGNHLPLVGAILGNATPPSCGDLVATLEEEIARYPGHAVVLTSENLESHFRVETESRVVGFFRRRGYAIKLVCAVRPQPERINASYTQVTKSFVTNRDFVDYARQIQGRPVLNYSRWLQIAREQETELIALPYNTAARKEGIITGFLRIIALPELAPPADAYRVNRSAGAAAVAAARTCMDRLKSLRLRLTQGQRVRSKGIISEAGSNIGSTAFCGLTLGLTDAIRDHYRADNECFAKSVWGATWDDVFPATEPQPTLNEIDRNDAASPGHAAYRALLDLVWPKVLRIAQDPGWKEPTPWERKRKDWDLQDEPP